MITPALAALGTALLLAQAPAELPYEGGPVPDGYELVTEYNTQFLQVGAGIFTVGYAVGGVYGVIAGLHATATFQRGDPFFALLPLAGAFLALGGPGYRSQLDPAALARHDALLLASGGLQLIGGALAAAGYFFPRRVVRLKPVRPAAVPPAGALLPVGPRGSAGATLSLAF